MARIVILGGGAAGSNIANRLRRRLAAEIDAGVSEIIVIDQDDRHLYQPGLLFVPFGIYDAHDIVRSRREQLHHDITFRLDRVERLAPSDHEVVLDGGERLRYDVCVIASGAGPAPQVTEGLLDPAGRHSIYDFYSLDGATALAGQLAAWGGGHLVIDVLDVPIKGPLAPLEFAFLADWYFTMRGIRGDVDLTFVTPLDGPFPTPACRQTLAELMEAKGVRVVPGFRTACVDVAARTLISWDDAVVPYDLLVTVPPHRGASFVRQTPGLGDERGFVCTDPRTLQSRLDAAIFAIGDATDLPVSKDATVAHFEGAVLDENIARFLDGVAPAPDFDGHDNCFVETGFDKALLLDYTYDTEPLPGKFPSPSLGPLSLLSESHLNHLARMAFKWVYWNVVLPGHGVPGWPHPLAPAGRERLQPPRGRASSGAAH